MPSSPEAVTHLSGMLRIPLCRQTSCTPRVSCCKLPGDSDRGILNLRSQPLTVLPQAQWDLSGNPGSQDKLLLQCGRRQWKSNSSKLPFLHHKQTKPTIAPRWKRTTTLVRHWCLSRKQYRNDFTDPSHLKTSMQT